MFLFKDKLGHKTWNPGLDFFLPFCTEGNKEKKKVE